MGELKIHQAKTGCGKKLPVSQRKTHKSEAKSTRDSNHSDAHGCVRLETTHRGNGAQEMEAMVKETRKIKIKKMGKPCLKDENVFAKEKRIEIKPEERGEKTDIRNWLKKNDSANDRSQMKLKEDVRKKTG